MKEFKFAPEVQVGTIFKRIDRNGKVWTAEILNRTEYFADVKKTQPYKIKVADEGISGELGRWHWEDAEPTIERAKIIDEWVEEETGKMIDSIWGKIPEKVKVKTNNYYLLLKEPYSKYSGYDKRYKWTAPNKSSSPAEDGFDLFYKFVEEN